MQPLFLLLLFLSCLVFAFGDRSLNFCGDGCNNCVSSGTSIGGGRNLGSTANQWVCTDCKGGYVLWQRRCYTCASGKFFANGNCYSCDRPCATCTKTGVCTSCSTSYPLAYNSYCYQSCPATTWKVSNTACKACPQNCKTCKSDSYCNACQGGRYMYQNLCYTTCPAGTYGDTDFSCKPCPSICATCLSSTLCKSCVSPNMLYNSYCYNPCPTGSFPSSSGQLCQKCPIGCSACTNATFCSSCQGGFYKKDNFCYATCPTGTYGDSNYQCLDCPTGCSSCTNSTYCLGCKTSYFLSNFKCESTCPPKTYQAGDQCYDCLSTCATCHGPRQCDTCQGTYVQENSVCTSSLGSFSSCTGTLSGCEACFDSTTCLLCSDPNYFLYEGRCYNPSCPANTFARGYACIDCPENCDVCTSETTCSTCTSNFFLSSDNQCLGSCPFGYYGDAGKCRECPTSLNCANCSSASTCASCNDGFYMMSGTSCVANCPAGAYPVLGVCQSCSAHCTTCGERAICTACQTNWMLLNNECYDRCPEGFYEDNNACQVCADGCKNCTDANTCGACDSDNVFYQNTCLSRCHEGMYNATGVCQDCMAGCRICNSDTVCLQCAVGFVFFNHSCLTTCPDGYYNLDGICTVCPTGCTTCTSDILCQSCAFGYNLHETDVCASDISEKEVTAVKQMAKTAEATGTASSVVSSVYGFLNSGDPTAMFMGSLAKMLQYVKYINIEYPPKIKFMFGLQSNLNDTSDPMMKKVQKKIEDESDSPPLANNFGYYKLTSSFVSNCLQSLGTLAGIVLGIGVTCLVLYSTESSSKVHRICKDLLGILKWNLFLLMFCGMVGDIVFFSSFEFRKAQFDNLFSVLSFVTCILMNFLSIYVFYKLIQVNVSLQKARDGGGSMEIAESKWESCKVFFHSYKNKKFSQQAFMIFFLMRVLSFYLIIAYFSAYPFFQIIMITLVSFSIVIYLIIIRPFKSRLNNLNQIVFEIIILAFNGCVLVLAALDASKSESYETRKKLETILLDINLAAGFISTFFIVLKALVLLIDVYKEWKLAKQATKPGMKLKSSRPPQDSLKISNNSLTTASPDSLFTHTETSSQNIINLDTMTVTNMDQTYDMSYNNNQSHDISPFHQKKNLLPNQNNHSNILPSYGPSSGYNRGFIQGYQGNQGMPVVELQSNNYRMKKSSTSNLHHKKIKKRPLFSSNVANQILRDGGHQIVEERDPGTGLGNHQANEVLSNPSRIRRRQNRPNFTNGGDMITL